MSHTTSPLTPFLIQLPQQSPVIWDGVRPIAITGTRLLLSLSRQREVVIQSLGQSLGKSGMIQILPELVPGAEHEISADSTSFRLKRLPVRNTRLQEDVSHFAPQTFSVPVEKNSLRKWNLASAGALAALALVNIVWTTSQETPISSNEALIPAQYAKLILKPTKSATPQSASRAGGSSGVRGVQALNQQKVQSVVQKLLKQNLALANRSPQSLSSNSQNSAALKNVMTASLPQNMVGDATGNRNVNLIGGNGVGNGTGGSAGAGYGTAAGVAIAGQGKAFVSLDLSDAVVDEGLTKDEVGEVIHRHAAEIRYCYETALLRSPGLEGKLIAHFTIGPRGSVSTGAIKSSSLADARTEECVLRRVLAWKFPQPKGGVSVPITYPFVFKSLGT